MNWKRQIALLALAVALCCTPALSQEPGARQRGSRGAAGNAGAGAGSGAAAGDRAERQERRAERQGQPQGQLDRQGGEGNLRRPGGAVAGGGDRGAGPHGGDWLRQYKNMPREQQQRALESDPQFHNLPQQQQEQLRNRLNWFNQRSPDEQERIIERLDKWGHLSPGQRQEARQIFDRYHGLPDERQREIHKAFVRLNNMNADERQRVLGSDQFRSRFSDQEREIISNALEMGVPPARLRENGSGQEEPPEE